MAASAVILLAQIDAVWKPGRAGYSLILQATERVHGPASIPCPGRKEPEILDGGISPARAESQGA
ncbi:hypothetical protein DYH09_21650 [bacterium CPR1]|nr:hypothetical protein [bacterium CPR1]